MKTPLPALLALLVCVPLHAAGDKDWKERYLAATKAEGEKHYKAIKKKLDDVALDIKAIDKGPAKFSTNWKGPTISTSDRKYEWRYSRKEKRYEFKNVKSKTYVRKRAKVKLKRARADVERARKARGGKRPIINPTLLAIGKIGTFAEYNDIRVLQVTGKETALVKTTLYTETRFFYVQDVPMKGVVDGSALPGQHTDIFDVIGTKTHKKAGGSTSTVFVLKRRVMPKVKPKTPKTQ